MKKHITIGISTVLLFTPAIVLAHNGVDHSKGEVHVETSVMGVVNASGDIEVHGDGNATSSANKEEKRGGDTSDGRMYKGSASSSHSTTTQGNATSSEHRKFGWGFLLKWFGSHDEGPLGFDASSTPENAPRAQRFESFLDKIMNVFNLNLFFKGKVE